MIRAPPRPLMPGRRREAQRDGRRVAGQALGARQRRRGRAERGEARRRAGEQRGPLQEVVDRQARGEARGAVGRQHVVRAADVIADHLGRGGRGRSRRRCGCARPAPAAAATSSSTCSGARRSTSAGASPRSGTTRSRRSRASWRAIAWRGSSASWRSTAAATASASAASSVIRTAWASSSCSAWLSRSAAIQAGPARVGDHDDLDGPAIRSMPTRPNTWRLASATYALPGPTILSTAPMVAVPNASAAIAWAPPTR